MKKVFGLLMLATLVVSMSVVALASGMPVREAQYTGSHPGLPCSSSSDFLRHVEIQDVELIGIEPAASSEVADVTGTIGRGAFIFTPWLGMVTGDTAEFNITVERPNQVEIGLGSVREWPANVNIHRTLRTNMTGVQRAYIMNTSGTTLRVWGTITIRSAIAFDAPLTMEIDSYVFPYETLGLHELLQRSYITE